MQPRRQPKRHDDGKLFFSAHLKRPASLAASIFQSVNTIRGNDLFSIQYISHYRRNLVKEVHQCFHEIFLRNILPAPPINIPNFILRHLNLHSSTVPYNISTHRSAFTSAQFEIRWIFSAMVLISAGTTKSLPEAAQCIRQIGTEISCSPAWINWFDIK